MCSGCGAALQHLRDLYGREIAETVLWSCTPFPFGDITAAVREFVVRAAGRDPLVVVDEILEEAAKR